MVIILERNPGSKKWFYKYRKTYSQMETTRERIDFLEDCRKADIIPNFLRFRLPKNGCFDQKITHNYQMNLLRKNILNARETLKMQEQKLENTRNTLKEKAPEKCYHSIFFYAKIAKRNLIRESRERHNKKIHEWSEQQSKPLFKVGGTITYCDVDPEKIPKYVKDTLSLGPNNSVQLGFDKKDKKELLAECNNVMETCKKNNASEETLTDINVKTLSYAKRCDKIKGSKNVKYTRQYLKKNII